MDLSPLTRSRLHTAMAEALGVSDDPKTSEQISRAEFALLAVHNLDRLSEALAFSEALNEHLHDATEGPHSFCPRALAEIAGDIDLARHAARLLGARAARGMWTTSDGGAANFVELSTHFWFDYCRLTTNGAEDAAESAMLKRTEQKGVGRGTA